MTNQELDLGTQTLVERHVREMVTTWLKFAGVGNAFVLVGLCYFVVFKLPDRAARMVLEDLPSRFAEQTRQIQGALDSGRLSTLQITTEVNALGVRSRAVDKELEQIEENLKRLGGTGIAQISRLAGALADSTSAASVAVRIQSLERDLTPLRQSVIPTDFIINNPFMNGPDEASCPRGAVVTAIRASRGVGGKYAADGISELSVRCSWLLAR